MLMKNYALTFSFYNTDNLICYFCKQICILSNKGNPISDVLICKNCSVDHWYNKDKKLTTITLGCKINNIKYEIDLYAHGACAIWLCGNSLKRIIGFEFHPNFTPQNVEKKLKTILLFQ